MLPKKWIFLLVACIVCANVKAANTIHTTSTLNYSMESCEQQLVKYRKFLLRAIANAADFCENLDLSSENSDFQTLTEQRLELGNFVRLLVARLSDSEITTALQDVILDNCKQQMQLQQQQQQQQQQQTQQHEMKREYVMLGKKQRFHSWGGKRAPQTEAASSYLV